MSAASTSPPAEGRRGPGRLQWWLAAGLALPLVVVLGGVARDALRARALDARWVELRRELDETQEIGDRLAELRDLQVELTQRIEVISWLKRRQLNPREGCLELLSLLPAEVLPGPARLETAPRAVVVSVGGADPAELRALVARLQESDRVASATLRREPGLGLALRVTAVRPPAPGRRP